MRGWNDRRARRGAFTLVEVMVAVCVLAIVAIAVLTTQVFSSGQARLNSQYQAARSISQKYVEQMSAMASNITMDFKHYYPTDTSVVAGLDPFAAIRTQYSSTKTMTEPLNSIYAGTLTGGSSTVLTDSTAIWTANALAGYTAFIVSGTGAGQSGTIASNTATALTLGAAMSPAPKAGSVYRVSSVPCSVTFALSGAGKLTAASATTLTDNTAAWTINQWAGNQVFIVSDTGASTPGAAAGQFATIASNTGNVLNLSSSLSPVPTTASGSSMYRINNGLTATVTVQWTYKGRNFSHFLQALLIPTAG
jgi:prepilin-type N-terminal cleavage/methylation domain-containing protein